jgi:hypothetical protein
MQECLLFWFICWEYAHEQSLSLCFAHKFDWFDFLNYHDVFYKLVIVVREWELSCKEQFAHATDQKRMHVRPDICTLKLNEILLHLLGFFRLNLSYNLFSYHAVWESLDSKTIFCLAIHVVAVNDMSSHLYLAENFVHKKIV